MAKKKLTDRQRVLRRYPKAWCWRLKPSVAVSVQQPWYVDKDSDSPALGAGATAKLAWADAAKRLSR